MTHSQNVFLSVPAQHYFMGGIKVNHHSKTTMDALYAVGETAVRWCMGKTVWQVIRCLKVSFLRNVRLKIWWLTMKQLQIARKLVRA